MTQNTKELKRHNTLLKLALERVSENMNSETFMTDGANIPEEISTIDDIIMVLKQEAVSDK